MTTRQAMKARARASAKETSKADPDVPSSE